MQVMVVIKSFKAGDGKLGHRFYIGTGPDDLEEAGTLNVPEAMSPLFRSALLAGARQSKGQVVFIFEGDDRSRPRD
ncbi:MAG: hypothetical protein R6W82_05230 [bacterium]